MNPRIFHIIYLNLKKEKISDSSVLKYYFFNTEICLNLADLISVKMNLTFFRIPKWPPCLRKNTSRNIYQLTPQWRRKRKRKRRKKLKQFSQGRKILFLNTKKLWTKKIKQLKNVLPFPILNLVNKRLKKKTLVVNKVL